MSAGIAKLQLLIDLKNNLKAGLDGAKKHVEKATGDMQGKLDQFKAKNIEAFDAIKNEVPGVGRAISLLSNPYLLAAAAATAFAVGVGKSVNMALDWNDAMAQINVTAQETPEGLKHLSDELLDIGRRSVAPIEDVPKAFGVLIGALDDTELSLKALEPTLIAAKAGYTDIETTAKAVASVMSSTGIDDATKVYDVLFATMKAGNAEFKDIANYMPKVIPLARNLGMEFEETAGSYATLTKSLSPEAAATSLQRMMGAMSNANVVKNFKGLGVEIFDVDTGQVRPILDVLKDLDKQMTGLSDKEKMLKFDSLGLDQNASLGFSTLMQNLPQVEKDINAVIDSAGALEQANIDAATPLDDWKRAFNNIKATAITIGNIFLPVISAIGTGALFVAQNIDIVGGALAGITAAWTLLNLQLVGSKIALMAVTVATKIATAAQWLFNVAANANPIGIIVLAIGALIGGLVVAYNKFDKFRAIMQGTWEVIKGFGNVLKEYVIDRVKGLISGLGAMAGAFSKLFSGDFKGAWADAKQGVKDITGVTAAQNAFESTKNLKDNFTNKYDEVIAKSVKEKTAKEDATPVSTPDTNDPTNPISPTGVSSTGDAKAISGGSQTKNITINIDSFIKDFTPTHQSVNGMNKDELERWMIEMFMRVVRHAETVI